MEITKEYIGEFIKLPKTFDWEWVDQEAGFDKVFSFVPENIYENLSDNNAGEKEISRLLTKAVVHYAFVYDIPRAKVMVTNYGIDQPNQDKSKPAPWWDVRDLGLRYLKTADQALSKALTLISKIESLKSQISFFKEANPVISTPNSFNEIYSIGDSPEVYRSLLPLMDRAAETFISAKLQPCAFDNIKAIPRLLSFYRSALAFYALSLSAELPQFTFLNTSVVLQYEELPWQKSLILSQEQRDRAAIGFGRMADNFIDAIISHIKTHAADFPCWKVEEPAGQFTIETRKSGIYLL